MLTVQRVETLKCSQCGISEESHRELYGTALGVLTFSFKPDHGETIHGQVHLCRPCTHEVLPRRLLKAAGVREEELKRDIWN